MVPTNIYGVPNTVACRYCHKPSSSLEERHLTQQSHARKTQHHMQTLKTKRRLGISFWERSVPSKSPSRQHRGARGCPPGLGKSPGLCAPPKGERARGAGPRRLGSCPWHRRRALGAPRPQGWHARVSRGGGTGLAGFRCAHLPGGAPRAPQPGSAHHPLLARLPPLITPAAAKAGGLQAAGAEGRRRVRAPGPASRRAEARYTRPASSAGLRAQKCSAAATRPVGLDLCPSPGPRAGPGFAPPRRGRGPPLRPAAPPASSSVGRWGLRAVGGTGRKLQFPAGRALGSRRLLGKWVS